MMKSDPFVYTRRQGVGLLTLPAMEALGFACALSTREGGVSTGETATMNLSFKRKDLPENVHENYRRLAAALERPQSSLCLSRQVHGDRVLEATQEDAYRSLTPGEISREGDAWISDSPSLTLVRHHADCTPIYLADPVHRAMGLVHAGWRGTVDEIAVKTLQAMGERFGSRPEDVWAAIGPAIGPCCFEIGPEVISILEERFEGWNLVSRRDGRTWGNLATCNRLQLCAAGVKEQQILTTGICTSCHHELLFSHRREKGHTGIMASTMYLL